MNKADKRDGAVAAERGRAPVLDVRPVPISPWQSKTLILTQQDILIAFTSSSTAARSPDEG